MSETEHFTISDARFSPCRTWRYTLTRQFGPGPTCMFCCLNPSTADEVKNDPTVRRCIGYARKWGFGSYVMTNIFGYRSTDPKGLLAVDDPVGPDNDVAIRRVAGWSSLVVAAWGVHGALNGRGEQVMKMLHEIGVAVFCLGTTKAGHPRHPLYLPKNVKPQLYGGIR
jgi:hypothetical protein